MKKIIAIILVMCMLLGFAACAGNDSGNGSGKDKKSAKATELSVCIASEPDTIDPALNSAVDGATLLAHLFSGLAKWQQDENGKLVIVADAAKELVEGVEGDDGKVTYTYTLKDGLKWSDGKDVTAKDYEFAWQRAASPALAADYGYMFEVVDGYDKVSEVDDDGNAINPDAKLNVKAVDDKTLEVTLASPVSYWNELLAFPTYFPVREDVVSNESWATDPSTYVCNGLYKLTDWKHDSVITLSKNEEHPDAKEVTMDTIKFYLSDDQNNMLSNFKNGEWLLIDDVPTNEIANLKKDYPDEFFNVGQIGTYYVCWNVNEDILPKGSNLTGVEAEKAKAEIRNAVSLLLDRTYIVDEISQGGEVPASSFVAMGLTDADGSEFYKNTGVSKDYDGYFDASKDAVEANYAKAVEILKKYYNYDEATKKFTDFPAMTYLYNTSDAHKAIGEYIQSAFANVGITINMENQEWATFLNTRKDGDYSLARNGWVADYNDPICFIDMWTTASGNNDIQFGKGAHANVKAYSLDLTKYGYDIKVENATWAETYDVLVKTIKSCTDNTKRYALMHIAEDMIMSTGCITPIYYYTDQYMLSKSVKGFFSNPLGYKYFMYCTIEED
ncbi:MAG: peptide ABC transporter substrate-binding protein [Clostridiales bacterium]|nr:peptide ABC transporter substrate-binding protein [Clostridiales bacterium]